MVLLLRSRRDDAKNCVLLITEGMSDPELRLVLELATDEELMEFEEILYSTRFGCVLISLMLFCLFCSDIFASVSLFGNNIRTLRQNW